jgi:predicted metal-dependent enzyme (double-stranded beta helix superfamily)
MFDVDAFIAECQAAREEDDALPAVREVVERAVQDPTALADALPPDRAGITRLFVSDTLTVLKFVWGPGMTLGPHDHRMWAAIGMYTGGEDNSFFRRAEGSIVDAGGRSLRPGDTCLLGHEVIHAVHNPTDRFAGALHVYGGDFFGVARSEWHGPPYAEHPFDMARTLELFEAANR